MSYINKIRKKLDDQVTESVNIQDIRIDDLSSDDVDKVLQVDENLNLVPVKASTLAVTELKNGGGIQVKKDMDSEGNYKTTISHGSTSGEVTHNVKPTQSIKGIALDEYGHVIGISQSSESVFNVNGKMGAVVLEPNDLGMDNMYAQFTPSTFPVSTPVQNELDKKVSTSTFNEHTNNFNNPHRVTVQQLGLSADYKKYTPATLPTTNVVQEALDNLDSSISTHVGSFNNPHGVTASQITAVSYQNMQELNDYQKETARANIGAGTVTNEELSEYARLDGANFTGVVTVPTPTKPFQVANKHFVEQFVTDTVGIRFDTTYPNYEALIQNVPGEENVIYLVPAFLDSLINPYGFTTYEQYIWNASEERYNLIGIDRVDLSKYSTTQQIYDNYVKYTPYEYNKGLTQNQQAQARININCAVQNIFNDELPTTDTSGLYGQKYILKVAPYTEYQYIGQFTAEVHDNYNELPLVGDITKLYFIKDDDNEDYYTLYTWFEEVTLSYVKTGEILKISRADLINVPEWELKTQAMIEAGDLVITYATESGTYIEHYVTFDANVQDGDTKYLWESDQPRFQVIDHVLSASNFSVDAPNNSIYIIG